ncbi:peptide MFS transporter [Curtobacterium ammoniigenes]|uniref:peptide MFS transporter n=1 Tax=Curtobacterium ammoniigenes TaxID=395387 RepID=UPI0008300D88|nr:oligopeptide:H+ symporter [Curtobacterium ammoniigenes]
MQSTDAQSRRRFDGGFFGQPAALAAPFSVELWERFSFYGMQGILLIYLYYSVESGGLGVPQAVAAGIVGAYGGSVYLFTIGGAWLADRLLGADRTLLVSASVVMAGHIALAVVPGLPGVGAGLVLIALGAGGVKATSTTIVGALYEPQDPRRDGGFALYYLGINLGAFGGPILTGVLQSSVGFHVGFALAAVGMAAGLVQYALRRRHLPDRVRVAPNPMPAKQLRRAAGWAGVAVAAIVASAGAGLLTADRLPVVVVSLTAVAAAGLFVMVLAAPIGARARTRVVGFVPLFIASAVFWALYQQQFTVLTVYGDERLDRMIFGFEMPVAWVQSINPIMIIVLSGAFAGLWTALGRRQPSTPTKFALGTITMGLAFWLFLPFVGSGPNGTPLLALVAILFLFTVAELLLSPVGLAVATKLAPARFQSQLVALFFLSVALGTAGSGVLARAYEALPEAHYFASIGGAAVVVGGLLLATTRPVVRLMRGVR